MICKCNCNKYIKINKQQTFSIYALKETTLLGLHDLVKACKKIKPAAVYFKKKSFWQHLKKEQFTQLSLNPQKIPLPFLLLLEHFKTPIYSEACKSPYPFILLLRKRRRLKAQVQEHMVRQYCCQISEGKNSF